MQSGCRSGDDRQRGGEAHGFSLHSSKTKAQKILATKTLKSQRAAAQSIMGISPFPSLPLWLQVLLTEATPRLPSTSNPPPPSSPGNWLPGQWGGKAWWGGVGMMLPSAAKSFLGLAAGERWPELPG